MIFLGSSGFSSHERIQPRSLTTNSCPLRSGMAFQMSGGTVSMSWACVVIEEKTSGMANKLVTIVLEIATPFWIYSFFFRLKAPVFRQIAVTQVIVYKMLPMKGLRPWELQWPTWDRKISMANCLTADQRPWLEILDQYASTADPGRGA